MARTARQLWFGLVAGTLLSAMRAPGGLDLLHLGVPDARMAALLRAAALFALALPLSAERRAFRDGPRPLALFSGATVGMLVHGLFLVQRLEPATRVGFAVLLVVGTLLSFAAAGGRVGASTEPGPGRRERVGLVVAGMGVALALEHLGRYARLFTVGLPEGEALLAATLLACAAAGALAFAPLASGRPAACGGLAALTAAATLVGLRLADHLEHDVARDPLYNYLGRFGLDLTQVGTWRVTALLGAAFFVAPGFGLGATLGAARHAGRLASLVVGAGIATLVGPWFFEALARPIPAPGLWEDTWAWTPWAAATLCAVGGALLALRRAPGRHLSVLLQIGAVAAVFLAPRLAVWPLSPWYVVGIEPDLALPLPEGLLTVERERGGARVVTLDRKLLTPTARKQVVDERRIRWSFGLLGAERGEAPRVLFVGQMTPERALVFDSLGEHRLEHVAPWDRGGEAGEAVLELLFEGTGRGAPGERLAPSVAKERLAAGAYDLVIVAPLQGPLLRPRSAQVLPWGNAPAPVLAGLSVPEGTLAVAWVDAGAPLSARELPARALVAAHCFDDLSLGFVLGELPPAEPASHAALLATGEPLPRESGWALLRRRADGRARVHRARNAERLDRANAGGPLEHLAHGLALHYADQERSSPFDSYAGQIELFEEHLRPLALAAREELDPTLRAIWEDLAVLLSEKRMVDMSLVYLEPLARRFAPWPELDRAVAYAYAEFGHADEALALLDGVLDREPYQIDLLLEAARVAEEGGQGERALGYVERALAIQPGHREARMRRAVLLFDAGDPAGRTLLEELRAEDPDDPRLEQRLGSWTDDADEN